MLGRFRVACPSSLVSVRILLQQCRVIGQVVTSIERALVAVDSVDLATERWRSIGFAVAEPQSWHGTNVADIELRSGGIRLISPGKNREREQPNSSLNPHLLSRLRGPGEGLLGWTWSCPDPPPADMWIVDPALTPGAVTVLEAEGPAEPPSDRRHINRTAAIDHIVIVTGDVDETASAYERTFSLRAHAKEMKGRRFAFLKVGGPVIEITGPIEPDTGISPGLWGLALLSDDLEESVSATRLAGVEVSDPKPAIQGGRIVSLRKSFSGIPLAWLGS